MSLRGGGGGRRRGVVGAGSLVVAVLAGCGDDDDGVVEGVEVPDGFSVIEVVTGLERPTQIAFDDDGALLVAQLAGSEGGGSGQVLRLDLDQPEERDVVVDGLLTPTGVASLDGAVWVMEQRRLSRVGENGTVDVIADELPFNGRSEGTLTATDDGRLLYNTSGSLDGIDPAEGSGNLWSLTPGAEPVVLASGLKNGYAHTFDTEGRLWGVEMSDGTFDGSPAPDEVVLVEDGADFDWPQCIGDGTAVEFYDGTAEACAAAPASLTLFDPGATPTSIAVAPWDPALLVVTLWNEGRVVTVPIDDPDPDAPVANETFLTGIDHPQHVLADGDRLLLVDHDDGRILAITATG